jgi:hypothetical protein
MGDDVGLWDIPSAYTSHRSMGVSHRPIGVSHRPIGVSYRPMGDVGGWEVPDPLLRHDRSIDSHGYDST